MPRSVWRGTLSFGLVTIPVSLVAATEPKDVRFHLFDREGRRVRYRRVVETARHPAADAYAEREPHASARAEETEDAEEAPSTERASGEAAAAGEHEVAYEDLVRGYEVEPDAFVFLDAEDIRRARPEPSRSIDLEHFVRLEDIDPVFFEKGYHVVPARGAEKPYVLLARALERASRVGIGRFVLRTKPHLIALRPVDGALMLETLFFADEVRDARPLLRDLEGAEVRDRELEIAHHLIEALATEWEPSRYGDEYREELLRMIAERAPEHVPEEPAAPREAGARIDELMEALRRSVEEAKASNGRKGGRRAG
jgi:DNA end-binding protein Ku